MKSSVAILQRSGNILFSQWEEMLRLRLVVLKSCEHEDIHDLRVASRRFRAALNLLGPLRDFRKVPKLSKDVRTLTRTLGDLRNLDEALFFFGSRTGRTGLSGLVGRLAERRERERRKVIKALKEFRPGKLEPLVREIVSGITMDSIQKPNIPPLPSYLSNTSITLFEKIQSLLPAALDFENCEERHAMRIAIKKWRYFLEIVSRITEEDYGTVLDLLKKYQSLLGSMNDMTVFARMCRQAGGPADELAAVKKLLNEENRMLFDEFVVLAKAEPLRYAFML